jgi:hypothetical protein
MDIQPDAVSGAAIVIDYAHHEIHEGDAFSAYHSATGKNDGDKINLYFKTPNTTKYIHAFTKWAGSGASYFRILEGPTVTANTGTNAQAIYNRNRNSSGTSAVVDNATSPAANKYGVDVTITVDGTKIYEEYAGAARSSPGEGRSEAEFILKANTAYCFQVESDAAALSLFVAVSWYEHTAVG